MVATGVYIASLTTGWISFGLTVLTWIGVYISLLTTFRSAPQQIPLILGNLRQEFQAERSLTKHDIREGDPFGVFPGRLVRRVGKNESHSRLAEVTLETIWKQFKALEAKFLVKGDQRHLGEVEDTWSNLDSESSENEKDKWVDEKGGSKNRMNAGRRLRRRESQLKSRMGFCEAAISVDRQTYYNTNFNHRLLWWWKRDEVQHLASMVHRLQMKRIELEMYETTELVKRSLWVLGGMSGEDVLHHLGPPYSKNGPARSVRRRRSHTAKKRASARSLNPATSRSASRLRGRDDVTREVYEREIRRTRRRSQSRDSAPGSSPAPPAKVAGSTVSMSRKGEPVRRRSRGPSVVEYEVVNPGRIWVDVEPSQSNPGRSSDTPRMSRPQPAHFESYVRERGDGRSRG